MMALNRDDLGKYVNTAWAKGLPPLFMILALWVWLLLAENSFNTPLCNRATGMCREHAQIASPRTPYSTSSAHDYDRWFAAHAMQMAGANERVDVLFLGDSIMEAFRGTSYGHSVKRADGVPGAMHKAFAPFAKSTLTLAISGDQTQHLLWRIQELAGLGGLAARAVVILIGTNNLSAGMTPVETSRGILAVVDAAQAALPGARIVLSPLLPRSDSRASQSAVAETNALLQESVGVNKKKTKKKKKKTAKKNTKQKQEPPPVVWASGCGHALVRDASPSGKTPEAEWVVDEARMPDRLHPNARGTRAWLTCLARKVRAVMKKG